MGPASILKEVEDKESEGEDEEDEDEDLSKYKLDEVGWFAVLKQFLIMISVLPRSRGGTGQCFQLPLEQSCGNSSAQSCWRRCAQALLCSKHLHSKMGSF